MSKIEELPRYITYRGNDYSLRMHITAWDKICLCYHSYKAEVLCIFCQVIDPESQQSYIPYPTPEDIIDCHNFNHAIKVLTNRLQYAIKTDLIKV